MMRQAFYSAVRGTADVAWRGLQWANRKVPARSFQPAWSPEPLPKSHERTKPPLGFPRRTDSLCPVCTREVPIDVPGSSRLGIEGRELVECGEGPRQLQRMDRHRRGHPFNQVGQRADVVGMPVGIDDPKDVQPQVGNDPIEQKAHHDAHVNGQDGPQKVQVIDPGLLLALG